MKNFDTDELAYSNEGLFNRDYFLNQYTEMNFYFEDTGKEYFYEILLGRLLEYKNLGVFCLNGKQSLYKKHEELLGKQENEKSIFIADGDFDKLIGLEMIECENFIYLEKYNIESYLLDIESINTFIQGNFKVSYSKLSLYIDVESWYKKTIVDLSHFFVLYSIQKKLLPDEKIFNFDIIKPNGDILLEKYSEKKSYILGKISDTELDNTIEEINNKIFLEYNNDYSFIICGKHLLKSLKNKIRDIMRRKNIGHNFYDNDFEYFIINNMDMTTFYFIKESIQKFIKKN